VDARRRVPGEADAIVRRNVGRGSRRFRRPAGAVGNGGTWRSAGPGCACGARIPRNGGVLAVEGKRWRLEGRGSRRFRRPSRAVRNGGTRRSAAGPVCDMWDDVAGVDARIPVGGIEGSSGRGGCGSQGTQDGLSSISTAWPGRWGTAERGGAPDRGCDVWDARIRWTGSKAVPSEADAVVRRNAGRGSRPDFDGRGPWGKAERGGAPDRGCGM
jgi:hypothetical protein